MDALGPLRPYFQDSSVRELQINCPDEIFVKQRGRSVRLDLSLTAAQVETAISLLAGMNEKQLGKRVSRFILSAHTPGFRFECVLPPIATRGPTMCIRRHEPVVIPMESYVADEIVSEHQATLLRQIAMDGGTFLVSGATDSGKTTFMNALIATAPRRMFVVEQVQELVISHDRGFVRVECDPENGVTATRALQVAMRNSPELIVVGELRGPEAMDYLDAANTGHAACATIHCDSAAAAMSRLEDLCLQSDRKMTQEALQTRVGTFLNWVVHIEKLSDGLARRVTGILKIKGFDRSAGRYITEDWTQGRLGSSTRVFNEAGAIV